MENESASNIEEWINQLAQEIKKDRHNNNSNSRVHSIRTHPALQLIASALDVRAHTYAGELDDAGDVRTDTAHHIEVTNDSAVFHYTIPRFAHTVYLPVRKAETATILRPELRTHAVIVRRCFVSLLEYCKWKKRKRQGLIKGLLFWRRNTLLNTLGQWRGFTTQNRIMVLQSCFSHWREHCARKKRFSFLVQRAIMRRSKEMLGKSLIAWKRFVPIMRRERSRQFFVENRHNLLTKAQWFERWLTSFQRSHSLKMIRRREEIRILDLCLQEWKAFAFRSKAKLLQNLQVNSYYRYNALTKMWRNWFGFAETSSRKKQIAQQAIAKWLVKLCLRRWIVFTNDRRKWNAQRDSLVSHIVSTRARFYIHKWRTALYISHAKTRAALIFFLHKKFVRWKAWTRKRKQSRLAAYYFGLRFFRRWYNSAYEKQRTRQLETLAHGFYTHRTVPFQMQCSINIWQRYVEYQKYKKKLYYDSALYFVGYLMPKRLARCIAAWKVYAKKRQLSRAQDLVKLLKWNKIKLKFVFNLFLKKFIQRKRAKEKDQIVQHRLHEYLKRKYTLLAHTCFRKWRAHVLSVAFFKASRATSHFAQTLLEKCFLAWVTFTKRRIMTHVAAVVYRSKKLRSGFHIWKKMLNEQRIKWRIAELYNKQHLLAVTFSRLQMYNNFAKQAVELKMYPLIKKREHKMQAKAFHAWTVFVRHGVTKRDLEVQAFKFYIFHQLSHSFSKWEELCRENRRKKHKLTQTNRKGAHHTNGKPLAR